MIYAGHDNVQLIEAAVRELQDYDSDLHYLRIIVTLGFARARAHRFHQLYFELGQALYSDASGYRLLNFHVKHKSTNTYQITFVCRYVGLHDFAYTPDRRDGLLKRIMRLTG